jgi:flagellar hook-associated protein 2
VKAFFTTETSGFSARSKQVLDTLAGAKSSVLINANNSIQAKVLTNTKRIDAMNARLEKSRTRLLTQFYNMETAIAKLKNNLNSIASIQNLSGSLLSSE